MYGLFVEYGASGDCRDGGVVCGPEALDGRDQEIGASSTLVQYSHMFASEAKVRVIA